LVDKHLYATILWLRKNNSITSLKIVDNLKYEFMDLKKPYEF